MNTTEQPSSNSPTPTTRYLALPEGQIAYDDTEGTGPLVVLVPGIGDLRQEYRFVAGPLADAGYRVVTVDIRGLGESDTTFERYDGEALGQDLIALIRSLGAGPATIMGTSMAAGSAVYAAAEAPELVSSLVLIGGFTRGPVLSWSKKVLVKMLVAGPWRTAAWMGLHGTLFPLAKPADHEAHRARMRANLREPGRSAALAQMMLANHAYAEARYDEVKVPSLFVMGTADSDFDDPAAEANEVAAAIGGSTFFVDGAGHYPHVEAPQRFLDGALAFLDRAQRGGATSLARSSC